MTGTCFPGSYAWDRRMSEPPKTVLAQLKIALEYDDEDHLWIAHSPHYPSLGAHGETQTDALAAFFYVLGDVFAGAPDGMEWPPHG